MPSIQSVERPDKVLSVANQYLKRERPLSTLLSVLVVAAFLVTYAVSSLLTAIAVAAGLLLIVRVPIIRPRGVVRLQTTSDVETVVESFTGATPPILPFQWGIADEITTGGDGVVYHISYLFDLKSVAMTVENRVNTRSNGGHIVELTVTVDDQPWATYTAEIYADDGRTIVNYEYTTNRRFGLRRLPQRLVARRYRNEALAVQGYTIVHREDSFGV
jgi:hypothetical protein